MLPQYRPSRLPLAYLTQKAIHLQVKIRIIILHNREKLLDDNLYGQFLADFPNHRLLRRFPWLDLPAGKLPLALLRPISPLGCEDGMFTLDDGSGYFDCFHAIIHSFPLALLCC